MNELEIDYKHEASWEIQGASWTLDFLVLFGDKVFLFLKQGAVM